MKRRGFGNSPRTPRTLLAPSLKNLKTLLETGDQPEVLDEHVRKLSVDALELVEPCALQFLKGVTPTGGRQLHRLPPARLLQPKLAAPGRVPNHDRRSIRRSRDGRRDRLRKRGLDRSRRTNVIRRLSPHEPNHGDQAEQEAETGHGSTKLTFERRLRVAFRHRTPLPNPAQISRTLTMNLEIFAIVIGLLTLAVIINQNTVALLSDTNDMRDEMRQFQGQARRETNDGIENVRTDVRMFRTEMNELVQKRPTT